MLIQVFSFANFRTAKSNYLVRGEISLLFNDRYNNILCKFSLSLCLFVHLVNLFSVSFI